jgi:hypothetical protein
VKSSLASPYSARAARVHASASQYAIPRVAWVTHSPRVSDNGVLIVLAQIAPASSNRATDVTSTCTPYLTLISLHETALLAFVQSYQVTVVPEARYDLSAGSTLLPNASMNSF